MFRIMACVACLGLVGCPGDDEKARQVSPVEVNAEGEGPRAESPAEKKNDGASRRSEGSGGR